MIADRSPKRQHGFSILEVLVAMSVAMILLGIGVSFSFRTFSTEKKIERIAGQLESAVRQASMSATIDRRDAYLTLFEKSVKGSGKELSLGEAKLSIMNAGRFGKWAPPPRDGYFWKFDANGLLEPLHLKLAFSDAEVTMDFDPLTGVVRDRTMIIY